MSRTKKGTKGPGAEYWGTRSAGKKVLRKVGRESKVLTARRERRVGVERQRRPAAIESAS